MKTTMLGLAATVVGTTLMFLVANVAQADDRGNAGWRLGERNRDGYAIYRRDRGNWYRVPGSAVAVADGWVLGSRRESGGYAIYRWNGYNWDQAPGGAVEIGGTYNRPWVVNNRGQRFTWNGYDWRASGYAGNRGNSFRGNSFGRDFDRWGRDRNFRDRGFRNRDFRDRRDRNRYRGFDRRWREWDPYRFDERRRFGKRDFWRRR